MRRQLLILVGAAVGVVLGVGAVTVQAVLGGSGAGQSSTAQLLYDASPIAFVAVGTVIVWKRRGSTIGLILYLGGLAVAVEASRQSWSRAAYAGAGLPHGPFVAYLTEILWVPAFAVLFLLLLLFPDGHLLSPLWRPVLWLPSPYRSC